MKTKYYFLAAIAGLTLASCSSDDFVGDLSPTTSQVTNETDAINFGFDLTKVTRGDIGGPAAAELLGSHFYVTGTKGTEPTTSPTTNLVFDNYLVRYQANTAGTTESNTANWEYVGVVPGEAPDANYVKLSSLNSQTIKYWDYSTDQYDFLAFSTGTFKAVSSTSPGADEIGVTAMKYGADLANNGIAYTFTIPSEAGIKNAYITDISEVMKANYGKDVTLRFKNLGSKVRVALYETVPGYSVRNVVFYALDGTNSFTDANKNATAKLISADASGIPTSGKIEVYFPHVGTTYQPTGTTPKQDYNVATTIVTPTTSASIKYKGFGTLDAQLVTKQADEKPRSEDGATTKLYLGRELTKATFAGEADADFYQTVFPVSTSDALTLRVDYTLVAIDGSGEEINVYGAKAVVPSTYTKWLPNYAYTYIFKISDNTNGWTDPTGTAEAGLFPITFDAVVAEATDATDEQTTITTVATPSITTYQQNHISETTNEYSIGVGKNVYVQVMDNSAATASLVTTLSATNSLLYKVDADHANATEAQVMDALQKRTATLTGATDVTGRNGIALTKDATNISNTVTSIVNGVDDNPITVSSGAAAEINISALSAGTYAYVYDYTTSGTYNEIKEYQPLTLGTGQTVGVSGKSYYTLTVATLNGIDTSVATNVTADNEAVNTAYIYFSKTTNGTGQTTYSYISTAGKSNLPAGLIKVAKSSLTSTAEGGTATAAEDTFYFDTYFSNSGKYAVKVIKIVA